MAAIGAIMLALLKGGDHVVSSAYVFGNTNSLLDTLTAHGADQLRRCDRGAQCRASADSPDAARFVETIANPRTEVADLARSVRCAGNGRRYVVDNTMTSPWLFRPAGVDASLVVNALTKYIGGHGNALGGAVTDTGRFDWTRYPNIATQYDAEALAVGHHATAQEGAARLRRHAGC